MATFTPTLDHLKNGSPPPPVSVEVKVTDVPVHTALPGLAVIFNVAVDAVRKCMVMSLLTAVEGMAQGMLLVSVHSITSPSDSGVVT